MVGMLVSETEGHPLGLDPQMISTAAAAVGVGTTGAPRVVTMDQGAALPRRTAAPDTWTHTVRAEGQEEEEEVPPLHVMDVVVVVVETVAAVKGLREFPYLFVISPPTLPRRTFKWHLGVSAKYGTCTSQGIIILRSQRALPLSSMLISTWPGRHGRRWTDS